MNSYKITIRNKKNTFLTECLPDRLNKYSRISFEKNLIAQNKRATAFSLAQVDRTAFAILIFNDLERISTITVFSCIVSFSRFFRSPNG